MHYHDWKANNPGDTVNNYVKYCRENDEQANLRGADLRWADLRGATGAFTTGFFGRHHAVAAGGYISIGCVRHEYDEWLRDYEDIGRNNHYTAEEIADYGAWIKLAVARQRRIEKAAK